MVGMRDLEVGFARRHQRESVCCIGEATEVAFGLGSRSPCERGCRSIKCACRNREDDVRLSFVM